MLINRLIDLTSGTISIGDRNIADLDAIELRRSIGYVIQGAGLFPHMSVADNIATVPKVLGWDKARIRARVTELLELVGLDPADYGRRFPAQLSGGQQQRVGIARALAADPPVMLMDEPFGALDNQTRALMQELLLGIWEADRKTVLFVTHDIDEAIFLANRVVVMTARPGRIKCDVAVDLPHPRTYTVKTTPEFAQYKARLTEEIRVETIRADSMAAE